MDELKKLNANDLRNKAFELRKQIAMMRFDKASGKVFNTAAPRQIKKELARVLTILSAEHRKIG